MPHLTEFTFKHDEINERGVLIDVRDNNDLSYVATELHKEYRSQLNPAGLVLVRPTIWPHPEISEVENAINQISERFPDASVQLLSSHDYQHLIKNFDNSKIPRFQFQANQKLFLDNLRSEELKQMVIRSKALYTADSSFVFRLPSRALSNSFLRAGNIQTGQGALDTLFFWLLPYLKGVGGILVDTWSISSIALNASRLLGQYNPNSKSLVRVEMLDHYLDGRLETRDELREILLRVSDGYQKPFLSLFSAAMTGKSLKYFSSALSSMGCPTGLPKYLVLFHLGNKPIRVNGLDTLVLCQLSGKIPVQIEQPELKEKTVVEIDPNTYFPVFSKEKDVRLNNTVASKHLTFFNRYKDEEVIRIHEDSYIGGQKYRHHGIYLDVSKMLENGYFLKKFKQLIDDLNPPPEIILVPPHDSGKKLATIAARHLAKKSGLHPEIVEHFDLNLVNKFREQISNCTTVLVLDDVMTTGSRFRGYQKQLRQLEFKGRIHYRAGVSRMSSDKDVVEVTNTLKPNSFGLEHTVDFVENIVLPNWDHKSCPICIESRLLNHLILDKKIDLQSDILDRAQRLRNFGSQGLVNNVFFRMQSTQPLKITTNSLFVKGGASQAMVLCSVAAAIQELRSTEIVDKRLDAHGFPVRRLFSINDLDRYTDGILRASLFRCLTAVELQRSSFENEKQLIEWTRKIFRENDADSQRTTPELALAIGLRKIPIEVIDDEFKQNILHAGFKGLFPIIEAGRNE